jgi:prolyl-tRNA synthetase
MAVFPTELDEQSKPVEMFMGCYGIGITRIVAAAIEQNNDANGIIWPDPLSPYQVVLIPMAYQKSDKVREVSDRLYHELQNAGVEVLFDDRDARPGVKFAASRIGSSSVNAAWSPATWNTGTAATANRASLRLRTPCRRY